MELESTTCLSGGKVPNFDAVKLNAEPEKEPEPNGRGPLPFYLEA